MSTETIHKPGAVVRVTKGDHHNRLGEVKRQAGGVVAVALFVGGLVYLRTDALERADGGADQERDDHGRFSGPGGSASGGFGERASHDASTASVKAVASGKTADHESASDEHIRASAANRKDGNHAAAERHLAIAGEHNKAAVEQANKNGELTRGDRETASRVLSEKSDRAKGADKAAQLHDASQRVLNGTGTHEDHHAAADVIAKDASKQRDPVTAQRYKDMAARVRASAPAKPVDAKPAPIANPRADKLSASAAKETARAGRSKSVNDHLAAQVMHTQAAAAHESTGNTAQAQAHREQAAVHQAAIDKHNATATAPPPNTHAPAPARVKEIDEHHASGAELMATSIQRGLVTPEKLAKLGTVTKEFIPTGTKVEFDDHTSLAGSSTVRNGTMGWHNNRSGHAEIRTPSGVVRVADKYVRVKK